LKGIRRPLPDIADHLAAAEGAVTGGVGTDFDQAAGAPVEICSFGARRLVTPRIKAPSFAEARALGG
jgi:hypothetical protein